MTGAVLRLVLLISCAHALCHIFELSYGNVEQLICRQFDVGKAVAGAIGTDLRIPLGLFAFLAGWLSDRFGAKRLLMVFLFGGALAAFGASLAGSTTSFSAWMFTLGTFAAIYHPAGVGLISSITNEENRARAMGFHGIVGALGIGGGPLLAGTVFFFTPSWRIYYVVLSALGVLLASVLGLVWWRQARINSQNGAPSVSKLEKVSQHDAHSTWRSFAFLTVSTSSAGIVYAAVLTFLPRYLDQADLVIGTVPRESMRVFLTSLVLFVGIAGQFAGGWLARPKNLEWFLAVSFAGAAPFVFWMGVASGNARIWAAAAFALMFFMHQPIYNSLIAKYVPRERWGLGYGLSFTCGFSIGAFGSRLAGYIESESLLFTILSGFLLLSGSIALLLLYWDRKFRSNAIDETP